MSDVGKKISKHINRISCDQLYLLQTIKSYTVRVTIVQACIEHNISYQAAISMWTRWVHELSEIWKTITSEEPQLQYQLEKLYTFIQKGHKYCFKSGTPNFISDLYLNGYANCVAGSELLVALGTYLGYADRVVNVLSIVKNVGGHENIYIKTDKKDEYYIFETTFDRQAVSITYNRPVKLTSARLDDDNEIYGWLDNDLDAALLLFIDYMVIYNKKAISNEKMLELFRAIFPVTKFTTIIEEIFRDQKKYIRLVDKYIHDSPTLSELTVIYKSKWLLKTRWGGFMIPFYAPYINILFKQQLSKELKN
jgi:hypothetical protein